MRHLAPLLIGSGLLLGACGEPAPPPLTPEPPSPPPAPVDVWAPYSALIGEWVDSTTTDKYISHERWTRESDAVLVGTGYAMKGRDTVFVEDLKLERSSAQVIYSARIESQNNGDWVAFTAQTATTDSLIFENPGHDFPQCITYVRGASTGHWNVSVSGMENGQERLERFVFTPNVTTH